VETSTFVIEFRSPIRKYELDWWLTILYRDAATVEQISEQQYRITCNRPRQLENVGWAIHHTALASLCRIIEVTGIAQANKASYTKPKPTN
jgi:hypothetical protein